MKAKHSASVPGPLETVELAVHLLRQNPGAVLGEYFMGSLPFFLGLLYFWSDMSRNPYAGLYCSPASAGLALLFIYMKFSHVRFCRRLLSSLRHTRGETRSLTSSAATAARQALIHATGIIVQPMALLFLLPLGWTTAFYQSASIVDDPDSADIKTVYRNSIRQSILWPGQNHLILGILSLFMLVVFINVSIGLMLMPYLLKTLLGVETAFTISGMHAMANTTFLAIALALTWLCIDPIIKAVYTLRYFYGQSRYSGDDLKVNLKRFLKSTIPVVFLCLLSIPFSAIIGSSADAAENERKTMQTIEYSEQLEWSVERVLQKREFAWRLPREKITRMETDPGWFEAAIDWVGKTFRNMIEKAWKWFEVITDGLQKIFPGKKTDHSMQSIPGTVVRTIIFAIGICLVVFPAIRLWHYFHGFSEKNIRDTLVSSVGFHRKIDLNDENVTADDLPFSRWLKLAEEALENQDFRRALRALYLAMLSELGEHHRILLAKHKSNRDYLFELSVRSHSEPELKNLFEISMGLFERCWYGMHPVEMEELSRFKSRQERISALVHQKI